MKAIAPGKVILSGEHAVVYGRPALATAVTRFAEVRVEPDNQALLQVRSPFGATAVADAAELYHHVEAARRRYDAFLADALPIAEVLPEKHVLVELAWDRIRELQPEAFGAGIRVSIHSDLPVGAGMGSSAAVAAALVFALGEYAQLDLPADQAFELCLDLERFQHGRPSGVDPFIAVHGGLVRYRSGVPPRACPVPGLELRLIHSGTPVCTTGECVYQVRATHSHSSIWDAFETISGELEAALRAEDQLALIQAVRRNHRLLVEIGVVPQRVCELISEVERRGGAGKVCGAGAVRGDAGGILWIVGNVDLPDGAGREMKVGLATRGAHIVG